MEKRIEDRINRTVAIFVHVHECDERPEVVDASIPCEATDFSPHGLRSRTNLALPIGTGISITIGISNPFTMYVLKGVVRWVEDRNGEHIIGVNFEEGRDEHLYKWIDGFERNFDHQYLYKVA
ncbi:MAG: PilZ domain-containing protein [Gammaproteobacteria bacterium]|jgi:hypothetical protein|nr:PilZ domain-containing protein [Gammaproteobacteria bacterium]MBT3861026.1 PilZ domain-containing protein [Gammaproteobacteria bacterium]MBT3987814.1 PilZ domain-containing protein [Gammaproteobacteria bacterium]MBT4255722.1 PilZ domain-containing protein [Gammaproteobacteria bacterium]MBT4581539.1 PilZ domain-containing protein [Gammaproteobacteria bacterium]